MIVAHFKGGPKDGDTLAIAEPTPPLYEVAELVGPVESDDPGAAWMEYRRVAYERVALGQDHALYLAAS